MLIQFNIPIKKVMIEVLLYLYKDKYFYENVCSTFIKSCNGVMLESENNHLSACGTWPPSGGWLAIEQKASDFNRDICLTNKIFAYAQAGLYILATNSSAQKLFMEAHVGLGIVSVQNIGEMENTIKYLIENIETIRKEKQVRYEYAKKLGWESESQKLAAIWQDIFIQNR
jgi:hypothetical protein